MKIDFTDLELDLNQQAVTALNDPSGLVGEGANRAGAKLADRIRELIESYDLVDTGEMLNDVTHQITQTSSDGVTVSAGTPNVEYTLYQREPFLLEALAATQPSDLEP